MRASILVAVLCSLALAGDAGAGSLRVATTTPDLASLAEIVGGDEVEVTSFVRGGQDPHFVQARPSFIRVLSRVDLFIHVGMQLEIGWAPALLRSARNSRIRDGKPGNLNAAEAIPKLGVLQGSIDRSMGDVHAEGNPHYLSDPINGLRVAREIRDRLAVLRPKSAEIFRANAASFEAELMTRLVGDALVSQLGLESVLNAAFEDRLDRLAADATPSGWMGVMGPHAGQQVVADHDLWPYFAKRFRIEVRPFLEPLPGITPTTRHLAEVVEEMKRREIRAILSASYFNPVYAQKVAQATGARVVEMANQVGARKGVDDYLQMIDWNVRHLADALE